MIVSNDLSKQQARMIVSIRFWLLIPVPKDFVYNPSHGVSKYEKLFLSVTSGLSKEEVDAALLTIRYQVSQMYKSKRFDKSLKVGDSNGYFS